MGIVKFTCETTFSVASSLRNHFESKCGSARGDHFDGLGNVRCKKSQPKASEKMLTVHRVDGGEVET